MNKIIGRPKTFETNEIISKAMQHFWIHGYDNSSLTDLLKALGIKRSSFYNTFKSKEELFSLGLDLYLNEVFKSTITMKNEKNIKVALLDFTKEALKNLDDTGKTKGCLLTNSGKECFEKYDDLSKMIASYYGAFIEFLTKLIEEAKHNKEISNPLDSRAIAGRYLCLYNGLVILKQTGVDDDIIGTILDSIEELLN